MNDIFNGDRDAQIAACVVAERAQEAMKALEGLNPQASLAALTLALTAVLERACHPTIRLTVLNNLLADTIIGWATAEGAEATRQ